MFSNLSLKKKLVTGFILSAIIPFVAISLVAEHLASSSLQESNMDILEAANQAKSHELSAYFSTIEKQAVTTALNPVTQDAVNLFDQTLAEQVYALNNLEQDRVAVENYWRNEFGKEYAAQNKTEFDVSAYVGQLSDLAIKMQADFIARNESPLGEKFKQLRSPNNSAYDEIHATYHPWFQKFLEDFGFYDIFLVNNRGVIVYSVFKELDYATSLETGPWKETGIAQAYRQSKQLKPGQVYWDDLKLYAPSYDAPAGFISTPIANVEGDVLGHLIFQMPLDNITEVVASRAGLGDTGETYLVGSDNYMRSDSALDEQNFSVVASFRNGEQGQVKTVSVEAALKGERGSIVATNYLGDSVISSYESVMLGDSRWAIISEKSTDEAFAATTQLVTIMLIFGFVALVLIGLVGFRSGSKIARPIEQVAQAMSKTNASGLFDQRVNVKTGDEVEVMADAFNELMSGLQETIDESNRVLGAIAEGDFAQRSQLSLRGDLERMQNGVNRSAESVDMTIQALDDVMMGLSEGRFSVRMSDQVAGNVRRRVNNAIIAIDEAMAEVGAVMAKVAQGQFDARVERELKGDLNELKSNVNESLDTLQEAISEISENVELLSEGDLTARIQRSMRGELNVLKGKFNYALENLSSTMVDVVEASNSVGYAASQVAQGSMDLSQRTQEQAATLEQTSASMEEMTATVGQNTDSAQTANQLSAQAREEASKGAEVVSQTVHAMEAITEASNKISDIITLIDGIAFQTNLLALNAAVEAARAGDHGRGFAVVAGEVRALAGKSADAAKDIKTLIESTSARVEEGSRYANASGEALEVINASIKKVSDIVSEISAASKEQQVGIEQVNTAVTGMDQVTQENAALVEETSAAAGQMNEIADQLRAQVNHFKLDVSARTSANAAPKPSEQKVSKPIETQLVERKPSESAPKKDSGDDWAEF